MAGLQFRCNRRLPVLLFTLVAASFLARARDLVQIPAHSYDPVDERTGIKVHVHVDSFLISPTETTQEEFTSAMGSNPSQYRGANLPVQNVSWWDAIRYCNARSVREGLHPAYDLSTGHCDHHSNGYRLPTDVEWTLAAGEEVSASAEKLQQIATLGSRDTKNIDALMQLVRTGPTPVASHPPNHLGLYDMLGNVWEWCQDFFDPVISYPRADNPDGPDWGIARVIRGGSFATSTPWAKGYRSSLDPDRRSRFTGFRVCRTSFPIPKDAAHQPDPDWFKPYNMAPAGFETSTGKLSPLLQGSAGAIDTPEQWQQRSLALNTKWKKLLGSGSCGTELPSPAIRVIQTFHEDGYNGTLAALQVETESWEDIFVMRPNRPVDHPLPVVIVPFYDVDDPAGKNMGGRRYIPPGVRSFALLAVQEGYIAVAIRWFGESYGPSYSEAVANLEARHPGCTGMGKWVSDSRELINYVSSLPDVDSKRIGIIGHSLGGKMALYAAAFDERIAVAVASEPGIGFSHSNYDDYWYFGKRLAAAARGTDQHELLALIAPRPFLLIGGDMFDGNDSWHYINAARQVYSLLNDPQNIGFLDHHQGHSPTPEAVWRSLEWLRHFLQ
ncbi:MAG TPA: SUMF1/EgtB/PvdO family nonheme iron enzyme [Bryobacteraceae bacterium]